MARIATVYRNSRGPRELEDMSYARWFAMSAALARSGHRVDIVLGSSPRNGDLPRSLPAGLRGISIRKIRWDDYDVVKTLFHNGYETLERWGGTDHPFIVAKLGSVVDQCDRDGIYFYGERREQLYEIQQRIARKARFATVLTPEAAALWQRCFPDGCPSLLVPGAAPSEIPAAGPDPFSDRRGTVCLFAGNVYNRISQPEANHTLVRKLNGLGERLRTLGAELYVLGTGEVEALDPRVVRHLGSVSYDECWRYLRHADVGIVVSAGSFMHNNESTKIYHYLRAGLPVVSESGFPNDSVITESGLGRVIESGDLDAMATSAVKTSWSAEQRASAVRLIRNRHTWDDRAQVYDALIRERALDDG